MATETTKHASVASQFDNAIHNVMPTKHSESSLLRGSDKHVLPKGKICMLTYEHNEFGYASISFFFRIDASIKQEDMEAKLEDAHGIPHPRRDLKHEAADVRAGSGIYYRDDKFKVDNALVSLYTKYCPRENFIEVGIYGHHKGWDSNAAQKIRGVLEGLDLVLNPPVTSE